MYFTLLDLGLAVFCFYYAYQTRKTANEIKAYFSQDNAGQEKKQ